MRAEVRKVSKAGQYLQSPKRGATSFLSNMRGSSRGFHVRPRRGDSSARTVQGEYFADLFAGHGGVAKHVRKLGINAKELELNLGPEYDLTSPAVENQLHRDLEKGTPV